MQQQVSATNQLASSQSHTSLTGQILSANQRTDKDNSSKANKVSGQALQVSGLDAIVTSATKPTSAPIAVAKSASSSSVLSSVSLSSGVQMKQQQSLAQQNEFKIKPVNEIQAPSKASEPEPIEEATESEQVVSESKQVLDERPLISAVARDPQIQTPKPQITELKRLLRHTNSLNQLPEYGVETDHEQELGLLMEQIDVWGLNIFEVHFFSQQHSLTTVVYKIFKVCERQD